MERGRTIWCEICDDDGNLKDLKWRSRDNKKKIHGELKAKLKEKWKKITENLHKNRRWMKKNQCDLKKINGRWLKKLSNLKRKLK
jgi:hypothetical protein